MDRTLTGSTEEDAVVGDTAAMVVASHADPLFLGRTMRLAAGGICLGRDHSESGLSLHLDRRLSRSHAELIRIRGEVVVRDLNSRNGTFVNGHRIEQRTLVAGDVVRVGTLNLVLRWIERALPKADVRWAVELGLLGGGPAHRSLLSLVEELAGRSSTVLIEGEPGVGKGVLARAIHKRSGRGGPLVTFDCGAVATGVLHSELFGHAAGAFSGASQRRSGLIDQARGGTLFLDEVGDAPPALQRALLRLLEEGEYRPVGSDRPRQAEVRIVAATNRDLDGAVEAERFRFDLLTRLRRLTLKVAPLRERIEDVGLLAHHFARAHSGTRMAIHRRLMVALLDYDWPGNVRELDAVMERAVLASREDQVLRWHEGLLPNGVRVPAPSNPPRKGTAQRPSTEEIRRIILDNDGNVTHAARTIGVARHTLYRWIRDADIDLDELR